MLAQCWLARLHTRCGCMHIPMPRTRCHDITKLPAHTAQISSVQSVRSALLPRALCCATTHPPSTNVRMYAPSVDALQLASKGHEAFAVAGQQRLQATHQRAPRRMYSLASAFCIRCWLSASVTDSYPFLKVAFEPSIAQNMWHAYAADKHICMCIYIFSFESLDWCMTCPWKRARLRWLPNYQLTCAN